MRSHIEAYHELARVWRESRAEQSRADRAAAVAAKYESALCEPPPSMAPFRQRMAELHRRIEARHLACARLHRLHAQRLQRWYFGDRADLRPVFMAVVAVQSGMDSAAVTLFDRGGNELLVATSDRTAHAAHDLELVVGEGPGHDVLDGRYLVTAEATDLTERWPLYGPALTELGVRSVVGVPLVSAHLIGTLCLFTDQAVLHTEISSAAVKVADALANTVLLPTSGPGPDGSPQGILFDEADYLPALHQAVGMVAVQCVCDLDAALALLRARAFTEGVTVTDIAHRVVEDGYQLC
ncbi:GAF domain-containing protein [Nocardia brasiliensis]|uniref:GAF domain-containing protein n=1 Tax=Nocardia brasiliensis TaxID=37326 RepID=UPI00068945EF|nr:GAF domain-containing protein [Nocardia brasiliensis]